MTDQPGDAANDTDAHARLRDKLVLVRERFVAGFDVKLAELVALAHVVASGAVHDRDAARETLGRGLHSLAGSAPTIGLTALGAKARALELQLARAAETDGSLEGDFLEELAALGPLAHSASA